jgi:thiol-disulfide isomerase/thioredoxin/uncharacterized membrane protein YphA (DoxX/SURF4 family)
MDVVLLIARLLFASIFAVAGVAKLADREGSRQAALDFGVPSVLAAPLGVLLPLAELAVAFALIPAATATWGAVGALALLLLFVAGIGANLARGREPECHCFGQLHSAPAGWKTLARNAALAVLAGFLVWQGWNGNVGPSTIAWLGELSALGLLALAGGLLVLALLGGQWWFLLHLLRQNGRLLVRIEALEGGALPSTPSQNGYARTEGLPVGTSAPLLTLRNLQGEKVKLDSKLRLDKPAMILFTDPDCGPCNALLPEVGRWQHEHGRKLAITLVSRGDTEENRAKTQEHGLKDVLLQEDWEASEGFRVRGTPSAVLVSLDGTIGSPVAGGPEAIRRLLAHAVGDHPELPMRPQPAQGQPCPNCGKVHANGNGSQQAMPAGVKIGQPAPEVKLPNLQGEIVSLEDVRGEETLVLFWNPGCGFCQRMLPDLKGWEANRPEGAPKLLIVSAGAEEANAEMGLTSTVVLDQGFAVGRAFGASGTPSAVLVDAEGKVASEVAVGAPGVLALTAADRA